MKKTLKMLEDMIDIARAEDEKYLLTEIKNGKVIDVKSDSWTTYHLKILKDLVIEESTLPSKVSINDPAEIVKYKNIGALELVKLLTEYINTELNSVKNDKTAESYYKLMLELDRITDKIILTKGQSSDKVI